MIKIDDKMPQLAGSGPLDARDMLATPQLLWHRTQANRSYAMSLD
jgi:hypothetical protein